MICLQRLKIAGGGRGSGGFGGVGVGEDVTASLHHSLVPLVVETLIRRKEALVLQQAHIRSTSEGTLGSVS